MEYVGVGLRAVAAIIDTVLLLVAGYVIAIPAGGATASGFQLAGWSALLWFAIAFAYYIVMETRWGATLGKRLVGLKVIKIESGAPLDWQASIVRNVLRLVDGLFFYLVGAIVIWFSDNKQRLGDKVAGTVVVRVPKS